MKTKKKKKEVFSGGLAVIILGSREDRILATMNQFEKDFNDSYINTNINFIGYRWIQLFEAIRSIRVMIYFLPCLNYAQNRKVRKRIENIEPDFLLIEEIRNTIQYLETLEYLRFKGYDIKIIDIKEDKKGKTWSHHNEIVQDDEILRARSKDLGEIYRDYIKKKIKIRVPKS